MIEVRPSDWRRRIDESRSIRTNSTKRLSHNSRAGKHSGSCTLRRVRAFLPAPKAALLSLSEAQPSSAVRALRRLALIEPRFGRL